MSWIEDLFVKKVEDFTYDSLKPEQVPDDPKNQEIITPNGGYISVDICSLRIVNVRKFTSKFYGVVHSYVKVDHRSGEKAVFQKVTVPNELKEIDPKRLDRVVSVNIPVLGPTPYRGGNIDLSIGLFSVKESDLAGPFLTLLDGLSAKAGVSVVNAALPFVDIIKTGVDAIVGNSDNSILEIGVSTSYKEPPKTGWWVIMRAPKDNQIIPKVKVSPGDYKLVDAKTGESIKDYPYVVFKITQSKQRNDWYGLPDLKIPYGNLNDAVRKGNFTDAADLLLVFKRLAMTSNDLLLEDGKRICLLVENEVKAVMEATQVSNAKKRELPALETYPLYS